MASIIDYLFGAASFMPHGYCLLWRPDLVALHVISDSLIAIAYFAIPVGIVTFVRRRKGLSRNERLIAALFVAFILLCGLTHVMGMVTLWFPAYGAQGLIKAVTALVSIATVFVAARGLPRLLSYPSPAELQSLNQRLERELQLQSRTASDLRLSEAELNQNLTERSQQLLETSQRFELTLRGSGVSVFQQDADLVYTWMYNAPFAMDGDEIVGRSDADILPEEALRIVVPVKQRVMRTGEAEIVEVPLELPDMETRWYKVLVEATSDTAGMPSIACVAIDISDEKNRERQLRFVMRELTHRTKNLMAIVQAIARQTARNAATVPEFLDRFGPRLMALSRAHDVLVTENWAGASLSQIIADQLTFMDDNLRDRITCGGPEVRLTPDMSQNLALAIHELSTNAHKHGALSSGAGRVDVKWRISAGAEGPEVELSWVESDGGPSAMMPEPSSFGRVMLERLLPGALNGSAELVFAESGLQWRIAFPVPTLPGATPGQ